MVIKNTLAMLSEKIKLLKDTSWLKILQNVAILFSIFTLHFTAYVTHFTGTVKLPTIGAETSTRYFFHAITIWIVAFSFVSIIHIMMKVMGRVPNREKEAVGDVELVSNEHRRMSWPDKIMSFLFETGTGKYILTLYLFTLAYVGSLEALFIIMSTIGVPIFFMICRAIVQRRHMKNWNMDESLEDIKNFLGDGANIVRLLVLSTIVYSYLLGAARARSVASFHVFQIVSKNGDVKPAIIFLSSDIGVYTWDKENKSTSFVPFASGISIRSKP